MGDYFRRMKTTAVQKSAILATAGKLVTIYYKMVRHKQDFKPVDLVQYQQDYKKTKIAYFEKTLKELKMEIA